MRLIDIDELRHKIPKELRSQMSPILESLSYVNSKDLIYLPYAKDPETILESQEFGDVPWDSDVAIQHYLRYLETLKRKDLTQDDDSVKS